MNPFSYDGWWVFSKNCQNTSIFVKSTSLLQQTFILVIYIVNAIAKILSTFGDCCSYSWISNIGVLRNYGIHGRIELFHVFQHKLYFNSFFHEHVWFVIHFNTVDIRQGRLILKRKIRKTFLLLLTDLKIPPSRN